MSTNQEKVNAQIQGLREGDEQLEVETFITFPNGNNKGVEGIVLVHRLASRLHEWIVWRWATALTDGSPPKTHSGAMLWSGGYYEDRTEAEKDLMERPR